MEPGIRPVFDDAPLAGISTAALHRATVAGVRRRAVENRSPRIIRFGTKKIFVVGTGPLISGRIKSETSDTHPLRPAVGMASHAFETGRRNEQENAVSDNQQDFRINPAHPELPPSRFP